MQTSQVDTRSIQPAITRPHARVDVDMNSVLYKALNPARRWRVEFEYNHAPFIITVKASSASLAVDVAETELWLNKGRPAFERFDPKCVSCVEVSA